MAEIEVTEAMIKVMRSASRLNGFITVYVGDEEEPMVAAGLIWTDNGDCFLDARGYEWLAAHSEG